MSAKSKRLGSLADVFFSETLDGTIRKIPLSKIKPSENQPRKDRQKGIDELALSLKADGLLQPIVVARSPQGDTYKIIAGERRYHAANSLHWQEIECKIFDRSEEEVYKLAIIENLQRENLTPYEEAEAFRYLKDSKEISDQDLGEILGKSRSYMTEILSIATLPSKELQACKEANIQNKNLLVQAVQAFRKGSFDDFLKKVKEGEVRTVKEAKGFNKGEFSSKPANSFSETIEVEIKKTKDSILVFSKDSKVLNKLMKVIEKEVESLKSSTST
jgi:ParB family chromosome partitioning protein